MLFRTFAAGVDRKRGDNGIFYGSLITAIVAFYTLLSLKDQDIIHFLRTLESEALDRLFTIIPVLSVISLFFLFFLVFFALRYELGRRMHGLGLYRMLGMRRRRLFAMLLVEHLGTGLVSLLIGLPVAFLLTEAISLLTMNWVGMDLMHHHFTISWQAVIWTIIGFIGIQLIALFIISISIMRKTPAELMYDEAISKQRTMDPRGSRRALILGCILIFLSWMTGIFIMPLAEAAVGLVFLVIFIIGSTGVFLFYRGAGHLFSARIRKDLQRQSGLSVFTFRQIQETIVAGSRSLAISSLLMMLALSSLAFGCSTFFNRHQNEAEKGPDISITAPTRGPQKASIQPITLKEVENKIPINTADSPFKAAYAMDVSFAKEGSVDDSDFLSHIEHMPSSPLKKNLLGFIGRDSVYLIRASSFDHMLEASGKQPLALGPHETALYSSLTGSFSQRNMQRAFSGFDMTVRIGGQDMKIRPVLEQQNIVADRTISIAFAYIVPDPIYEKNATDKTTLCIDLHLSDAMIKEHGLLQSLQNVRPLLQKTGFAYDTYLSGIGRQIFYAISSSYLFIYLGLLFLLISNTVLGIKFLNTQRSCAHRYRSLIMLGAERSFIARSAIKQVRIFFAAVLLLALVNSIFAIISMFGSLSRLPETTPALPIVLTSAILLIGVVLIELIYLNVVKRTAQREIGRLKIERQL